jgi:phosphinothricin acetyltransferase
MIGRANFSPPGASFANVLGRLTESEGPSGDPSDGEPESVGFRGTALMDVEIGAMSPADWQRVEAIYREGIAAGQATFELEVPTWEQWDARHHPFARLVARLHNRVIGWAALSPVSARQCYAGVAEVSVYVDAEHRGLGVGRQLLLAAIAESERHGIWTLQGGAFAENEASLRLQRACGFREIGKRERIGQLHSIWRDTILTERRSPVVGVEGQ